MVLFLASILACLIAYGAARVQFAGNGRISVAGFNGASVLVGFVVVFAGATALGPEFGVPLLIALLFHELGQVLGYRMLGHDNACFRLVPFISGRQISDIPKRSDSEVFLASILGPAINMAPMIISMTLAAALDNNFPDAARWFWILGAMIGTVNFLSLLPFQPMNGGICTIVAVKNFWPALAPSLTVFMCAAFASASFRTGSVTLMVMAGIGIQGLFHRRRNSENSMSADTGLTALAAYTFTFAAHFYAGWFLLSAYF